MIPGPPQIFHCPACDKTLLQRTLLSGNTFGAKLWSDGKVEADMLPSYPQISKCPDCDTIFWVRALVEEPREKAGSFDRLAQDAVIEDAPYLNFLSMADLSRAIFLPINKTDEDELNIRYEIMKKFNDRIRKNRSKFENDEERDLWTLNLARLFDLTTPFEHLTLLRAEIRRNQGQFDAAIDILSQVINIKWVDAVSKMTQACLNHRTEVIQI